MTDRTSKSIVCQMAVALALVYAATLSAQTPAAAAAPAAQAAPAAPVPNWKSYSYASEGFLADFPFQPEMKKQDVPTEKGSFELRAYLVEDSEAALFVGVCDYGSAVAGREPDSVLDGAQEGAISNVSAHLVRSKRITLGIYRGVEFEAENDTMHFTARIFLVGSTLYQTLTAAPLAKPYSGVTRFLDSFQLIARTAN